MSLLADRFYDAKADDIATLGCREAKLPAGVETRKGPVVNHRAIELP